MIIIQVEKNLTDNPCYLPVPIGDIGDHELKAVHSNRGVSTLKHSKPLSQILIKKWKLQNCNFRYYYLSAPELLSDFKRYQIRQLLVDEKQANDNANYVHEVWRAVDSTLNIERNQLRHKDAIQDFFFTPLRNKLAQQNKLPEDKQENHYKATTIQVKLNCIKKLVLFLITKDIYAGYLNFILIFIVSLQNEFEGSLSMI